MYEWITDLRLNRPWSRFIPIFCVCFSPTINHIRTHHTCHTWRVCIEQINNRHTHRYSVAAMAWLLVPAHIDRAKAQFYEKWQMRARPLRILARVATNSHWFSISRHFNSNWLITPLRLTQHLVAHIASAQTAASDARAITYWVHRVVTANAHVMNLNDEWFRCNGGGGR